MRQRSSLAPRPHIARRVERDNRRALRQTVALVHRNPCVRRPLQQVWRHRSTTNGDESQHGGCPRSAFDRRYQRGQHLRRQNRAGRVGVDQRLQHARDIQTAGAVKPTFARGSACEVAPTSRGT